MGIENLAIKFESDAVPPFTLVCTRVVGEERLSTPFRFELELLSTSPALDLEKILYAPARLGLEGTVLAGQGRTFRWYHGALASLTELEQEHGLVRYRADFVPDLRRLDDFRRSRVFLDVTIDELVKGVLKTDLGLESDQDFELRLGRTGKGDRKTRDVYPEREYVVQYDETDLAFLSRWLEREGIFYFFDNDGTRERVVFADAASAYRPAASGHRFRYRPAGGGGDRAQSTGASEDVVALRCTEVRRPGRTVVTDWNWRDPSARIVASEAAQQSDELMGPSSSSSSSSSSASVSSSPSSPASTSASTSSDEIRPGVAHEHGPHVRTPAQAKALAKIRNEAHDARSRLFEGRSTCRSFRPGKSFELEGHFRPDFNGDYVVVAVRHVAEQAVNFEAGVVTSSNYENTFEAVPRRRTFRPARTTPWPAIRGVITARVDSAGDGEFADLDDEGRYLVRLPWDLAEAADEEEGGPTCGKGQWRSKKPAGRASRRVRMAQPYGGPGVGLHLPLRKGTEVLLTHVDGDPDRPLIAAAVPNPEAPSPVDRSNHMQNRLHTTSGNALILDDDPDLAGLVVVDATCGHMRDLRQAAPPAEEEDGASGGGGGEPAPWLPPLPRPVSEGLRRAIAGGRPLPSHQTARAQGGGQGGDPTVAAAVGAKTTLAAYLDAWSDDQELIDTAIDRLTGFDTPAVFDDYKFVADRSDTTLTIENHTSGILVKNGDTRYTLDNVSCTYNYSTADGYTMNEAEGLQTEDKVHNGDSVTTENQTGNSKETSTHTGDKDSKSTHIGNSLSLEMHVGNDQKTELSVGTSQSVAMRAGADQSTELTLGLKDSLGLTLARSNETSITIGGATKLEVTMTAEASTSVTLGPKTEQSITLGPKNELSLTLGPETSVAINVAPKNEVEVRLSPQAATNVFIGAKAEVGVTIGYEASLALNLSQKDEIELIVGMTNKAGIHVGDKTEISVFAGRQMKIDISASILFELAIAAAVGVKINIAADGVKEINIPKKDEVALQKTVTALTRQVSNLNLAVSSLQESH